MKRALWPLLLAALIAALPAHAREGDAAPVLAAIGAASRAGERRATFVEVKTSALLSVALESTGTLRFRAPDLLEKVTLTPQHERVRIEGDRLTIEAQAPNGELRQKSMRPSDVPQLVPLIESLRATLAGDVAALERHYEVAVVREPVRARPANDAARRIARSLADPLAWTLQLVPRDAALRASVERLLMHGVGGEIGLVEFVEASGDRTELWITPSR